MPLPVDVRLHSALNEFQVSFIQALVQESDLSRLVHRFESIKNAVDDLSKTNSLHRSTGVLAMRIAINVKKLCTATASLHQSHDATIATLSAGLQSIFIDGPKLDQVSHVPAITATTLSQSDSDPQSDKELNPLRRWMFDHLAHPFPTRAEKEQFATDLGSTFKKVDNNFTNFRLRSGWNDLVKNYCNKDKSRVPRLLARVENGQETRQEVLDQVEKIRDFLTRTEGGEVRPFVLQLVNGGVDSILQAASTDYADDDDDYSDADSSVNTPSTSEDGDFLSVTPNTTYSSESDNDNVVLNKKRVLQAHSDVAPKRLRDIHSNVIDTPAIAAALDSPIGEFDTTTASENNNFPTYSDSGSESESGSWEAARPIWTFDDAKWDAAWYNPAPFGEYNAYTGSIGSSSRSSSMSFRSDSEVVTSNTFTQVSSAHTPVNRKGKGKFTGGD
ncbi:hypothetical protein IAR55_002615 [Kwoniella newhampshirensis]|uniref:KN homeodomain domain-containing protein n=1 Tax=Kwoniella newhampshirensis TaxID=1651941 RepID=A0AAW0YPF5_9TREE